MQESLQITSEESSKKIVNSIYIGLVIHLCPLPQGSKLEDNPRYLQ